MDLRIYQRDGIQMIKEAMIDCKRSSQPQNVMLAAPCAYGKTITAAYILKAYQDAGKRGLFICDRIKLVDQSIDAFRALGLKFGVIQSHHPLYDAKQPIQIASAQSLENFRSWPDADFIIVDEAHSLRQSIRDQMEKWNNIPFLGLSATPFSKGLGLYFNRLVVPVTPRELLEQGYLCPVDYYGGSKASLAGVKTKQLSSGGNDYLDSSLAEAIEKDDVLAGDIVKNWRKHAAGRMTIAFSPSVKHSKHMVELFNQSGVPAIHIDGYMDREEQYDIYQAHKDGEFLILSCSRLLNTGYDEPCVSCLIDCYPTKSIIQYVQRTGRILRTYPGKENSIYLDHAGNVSRHGFAEDIVPESLDDETKEYNEKELTKDKPPAKEKECPQCAQIMMGLKCKCGYEIPITEQIETDNQELEVLHSVDTKSWNKKTSKEDKARFYGMLKQYASQKGYNSGWIAHKYRERSGVWPNTFKDSPRVKLDDSFMNYLKHLAMKRARAA